MEAPSEFDKAYDREHPLFGIVPTAELVQAMERLNIHSGRALDVGCGDGRDTLELRQRGMTVTAIDRSPSGIHSLTARHLEIFGSMNGLEAICADIRHQVLETGFDLIAAITLLDHLDESESPAVLARLASSLREGGVAIVQVHTVDDPAVLGQGLTSEFAHEIRHYFKHNELLRCMQSRFRILFYDERIEWDYDHGDPHQHGMAVCVGVRLGSPAEFGDGSFR